MFIVLRTMTLVMFSVDYFSHTITLHISIAAYGIHISSCFLCPEREQKELMKSLETPEEKRARRLAKKVRICVQQN